jgi:hypothetical protein
MPRQSLYVVMLIAQSIERDLSVFSKPVVVCRDAVKAKEISGAEKELNNSIIVNGKECVTISGVFEIVDIEVPQSAKECWVVWSVAMMRDGTGRTMSRLEGIFGKEESATKKISSIPQGEQLINNLAGEVITKKARVKLI